MLPLPRKDTYDQKDRSSVVVVMTVVQLSLSCLKVRLFHHI